MISWHFSKKNFGKQMNDNNKRVERIFLLVIYILPQFLSWWCLVEAETCVVVSVGLASCLFLLLLRFGFRTLLERCCCCCCWCFGITTTLLLPWDNDIWSFFLVGGSGGTSGHGVRLAATVISNGGSITHLHSLQQEKQNQTSLTNS